MPIYAYRCENCGFAKDVLQKISDPLLTVCPSCGQESFRKQLTAAGFQLKGSGWYVTDFRDKPAGAVPPVRTESDGKPADAGKSDAAGGSPAASSAGDTKAAATPAPAPSSAASPSVDKPSSSS